MNRASSASSGTRARGRNRGRRCCVHAIDHIVGVFGHVFSSRAALRPHVPILGPDLDCLVVLDAGAIVFKTAHNIFIKGCTKDLTKHHHVQVLAGFNSVLALLALQGRDELDRLLERRAVGACVFPDIIGQVELNVRSRWVELAVEKPPQLKPVVWGWIAKSVERPTLSLGTSNL